MTTRSSSRRRPRRKTVIGPKLRGAGKKLGKHLMPKSRGGKRAMAIGFGLVAVLTLTVALVAESTLAYLVTATATLGGIAVRRMEAMQANAEQEQQARRARPAPAAPPPSPETPKSAGKPNAPPRCTATGKPTDRGAPDACTCAPRHVQTAEGAERYGLRIGDPIRKGGGRKAAAGS